MGGGPNIWDGKPILALFHKKEGIKKTVKRGRKCIGENKC